MQTQYSDGSSFVFKDIQSTMERLVISQNTNTVVLAHCGGSFDFQMNYKYFLSDYVLRLKKKKPPLLHGNKIISAVINKGNKLLDSSAFVTSALSKFPAIFQMPQLKKGFFLHMFNRP